jgi:hypothetical protein
MELGHVKCLNDCLGTSPEGNDPRTRNSRPEPTAFLTGSTSRSLKSLSFFVVSV